jgi:hypothetical protein
MWASTSIYSPEEKGKKYINWFLKYMYYSTMYMLPTSVYISDKKKNIIEDVLKYSKSAWLALPQINK